jgi:WD40 repeat protein
VTNPGSTAPVSAVAFSPDGTLLATASYDGTARLWRTATGRHVATLLRLTNGGTAVLLPDGSYKLEGDVSGGLSWAVKLCRFEPGELDPYLPHLRRLPPEAPILP